MGGLQVDRLSVRYGSVVAVSEVSLAVAEGEFVAIVGANGAGKSSLLNAIAGVVRPAAGTVSFDGLRIDALPSDRRALLGITLVPEDRGIFRTMTVAENLRLATAAGRTRDFRASLAEVFELFPVLAARRRQPAGQLSGGEQQMLAVGRALVARPRLLLLDEPSLGLAPILVGQLLDGVAELNRRGVTVILVEQHAMKAIALAGRSYILVNGRVAMEGTRAELLDHRSVIDAYLGSDPAIGPAMGPAGVAPARVAAP
jgi:branched-chain amino acid transport system ATP-binding protein